MDDLDTLTEAQAASLIGWSAANLRSHRLRYEAEQIAQALGPEAVAVIRDVRKNGAADEPVVDGYQGPALFRREAECWGLTRHGLEVARRCGGIARRSPAPPPSEARRGRVRYSRTALLAWLKDNPRVTKTTRRNARTWDYPQTAEYLGIALGTLRTLVSRAQVAQRKLDAREPDPEGALARAVERCPPWVWSGAHRRWSPRAVRNWQQQRQPIPDPLARESQESRGALITEAGATAMMGLTPQTLVGYRARARAALRRIALGTETERDAQRAQAHPPYVIRDGQRLYHEQDVMDWLDHRTYEKRR